MRAQEAYTCGMMISQCVRATTLDALEEGFSAVRVVADACRGCDGPEGDGAALKDMAGKGAHIVSIADCV
jgi:nicotinamidase-related amidase